MHDTRRAGSGLIIGALGLLTLLALLALPCDALAQSPRKQAEVLLREGNRLFHGGDHAAALDRFRRARALFPSYKIAFNLATTLDALGRLTEAATQYAAFLAGAGAGTDTAQDAVVKARARVAQLDRLLARLVIRTKVAGALVTVDGRELGRTPVQPELIYLTAGPHRVVLRHPGHPTLSQMVELKAGERRALTWPPASTPASRPFAAPAAASRPALAPASAPSAAAAPTPTSALAPTPPRSRLWAWISLGVGVACAAGAGVLYGVGSAQGDAAHERYLAAWRLEEISSHRADVESAERLLIGGHVLAGVAAAAIGLSIYQFVAGGTPEQTTVGLVPGPSGLTLALGGSF